MLACPALCGLTWAQQSVLENSKYCKYSVKYPPGVDVVLQALYLALNRCYERLLECDVKTVDKLWSISKPPLPWTLHSLCIKTLTGWMNLQLWPLTFICLLFDGGLLCFLLKSSFFWWVYKTDWSHTHGFPQWLIRKEKKSCSECRFNWKRFGSYSADSTVNAGMS